MAKDRELEVVTSAKTGAAEIVIKPVGASAEVAIFRHNNQAGMLQTMRDTFASGVNVFKDLERIKNPTSGGNNFRVQSVEGEKRVEKLVGIIIAWRDTRVFFDKPYGSGPVGPPACSSNDGIHGIGDPGGECATCKWAKFGSKAVLDGKPMTGQGPTACRQMRQLLILRGEGLLPEVLNATPGSLNQIQPYMRRLMNYGYAPYTVLTEISLAPEKSGGGIEYSQMRFKMLQEPKLTEEQMKVAEAYYNIFQPALRTIELSREDYAPQEQAPF